MESSQVTRREFLGAAAGAAGAAALSGCKTPPRPAGGGSAPLPQRPFGRSGMPLPVLAMGTAPAGMFAGLEGAASLFDEAIDLGVTTMDTAPEFAGYGKAQAALGKVLDRRRDRVFLVTKCWEPDAKGARALLEQNLRELGTDHADLVYAHSVGDDKMVPEVVQGKGGVLEMLQQAKRQGLVRFIGISGHNRPERFVDILRKFEVDAVMCAVNFADRNTYGFETRVFPEAARQGAAPVAMKVFGGMRACGPRAMMPAEHHDLALRYALGLPGLAYAVVGMRDREELLRNIERARAYQPLTEAERLRLAELGQAMAQSWGPHYGPVS